MDIKKIFKKMNTWNLVFVIFGTIGALMSVFSLVNIFTTNWEDKAAQMNKMMGASGASFTAEMLKPSMFTTIISVILTVVSIYIIYLGFKNISTIREEKSPNTLPYILHLLIILYNLVNNIIQAIAGSSGGTAMTNMTTDTIASAEGMGSFYIGLAIGMFVVGMIVVFVQIVPSVRMLMLNKKLNNIGDN